MTLGDKVKNLREQKNMTQTQLAERLGITQASAFLAFCWAWRWQRCWVRRQSNLWRSRKEGEKVEGFSFKEMSERNQLTPEEKKTAKQILALLNGQNKVAAKQMLNFCIYVIDCNSKVAIAFEEEQEDA